MMMFKKIIALCEEQGIFCRYFSEIFNPKLANPVAEKFEDNVIVSLFAGKMAGWSLEIKRLLDFCISLVLIIILLPFFLLIAAAIKFSYIRSRPFHSRPGGVE